MNESVKINAESIAVAWNADADEYNQWDSLGEDEKIEIAAEYGRGIGRIEARLGKLRKAMQ